MEEEVAPTSEAQGQGQGFGVNGSGSEPAVGGKKPLVGGKDKLLPAATVASSQRAADTSFPRVADAFLKSLGFISANPTPSSASSSLLNQSSWISSELGTKLSSVTDLFPPLAVWLTNIAVQVPAVYGKAPEHFVSLRSFLF